MFSKAIVLFFALATSVTALTIPVRRTPLTFGPFTDEQWQEYSQWLNKAVADGVIQAKRGHFAPMGKRTPLVVGPFTDAEFLDYINAIHKDEADGAIRTDKRTPLTFGPFTDEQWAEYTQMIEKAEQEGYIATKRAPTGYSWTGFDEAYAGYIQRMCGDNPTWECRQQADQNI